MKKSTIWILGIVMGLSFLSLLYLQVSYIEEMMKTRKEQFDSAVRNSLDQVSKDVEYAETRRWLIEDISEAERKALIANNASIQQDNLIQQTQRFTVKSKDGKVYSDFELKVMTTKPSELPKAMISPYRGTKTIPETSRSLVEAIKNRYMYQRALLDEVAWQMIYRGSDKSIGDRVRFKELDDYLKSSLYNNSIDLPYHFTVIDKDGREVYRCADYEAKGSEDAYQQALFKNDPPAKMSILKVHFPGKKDYIFDSISFMIPSLIFTLVLLVTFIFTIYIVFRQKKLTEMKNDFINNMTHEFKTPISTISLAAQMLKDPAVGKSPQMFQHISGVINDETKRLRFQVEKVLQMSMFERQKATLKMKEIDANELIAGVVNTFALKVERYNGKITSNLEAADPVIFADEMHITNVIFNLMDNAVKYKKPEEDLELKVRTWNESGKLMISIQDNGIGIKKENLKKIFEKGFSPFISTKFPLTEQQIDLLYETGARKIQVSLDSIIPSLLRSTLRVSGDYCEQIQKTIIKLDRKGFSLTIRSTLTRETCTSENIKSLIEFISTLANVHQYDCMPAGYSLYKNVEDFNRFKPTIDQLINIKNLFEQLNRQKYSFYITYDDSIVTDGAECWCIEAFDKRTMCTGNIYGMVILPDGKVTICEQLYWNEHFLIGDVMNNSLLDVWQPRRAESLWKLNPDKIPSDSSCRGCKDFKTCRYQIGTCWKEVIATYGKEHWYYPDIHCTKAPKPLFPVFFDNSFMGIEEENYQ